ncbi:MAG: AAA family ATPase [Nitrosopumilus sp.]
MERITLSDEQQEAFDHCTSSPGNIFIINGRPGTGKTTMAFYIVDHYIHDKKLNVALCAPTGRAAKRLSEKTGHPASTIHRLLSYQPHLGFTYNQNNPLPYDLIVVDETSMVDIILFYRLLNALSHNCKLILVGDPYQLPPVGPGAPFRDLINSGKVHGYELTKIHRQAADNKIITAAHAILDGNIEGIEWDGERLDLQLVSLGTGEDCDADRIVAYIEEEIFRSKHKYGLARKDTQILAPMRKATVGITAMNQRFQSAFNPPTSLKKEYIHSGNTYREGDRIIQVKNDYELGIFNGDLGVIAAINSDKKKNFIMKIDFDDFGTVQLTTSDHINHITLAYAMTIHKSQGSEYDLVIIPCHQSHVWMWSRPLIYTALTRAKRFCVLVGDMNVVTKAIKNNKEDGRMTYLKERLQRSDMDSTNEFAISDLGDGI